MIKDSHLDNILYWIALANAKYIGPRTAYQLLANAGSIENLFVSEDNLRKIIPTTYSKIWRSLSDRDLHKEAQHILQWSEANQVSVINSINPQYPPNLRECVDAPVVLYSRGNIVDWQNTFNLSVVGTRNITPYGQGLVREIISDLSRAIPELVIVSGLAYGVDIEAHRQALKSNVRTIAVLAHGLDRIYPSIHREDANDIISHQGMLLTEYPVGTKPERFNFVARNRIIAGLSKATLVIEAGKKSGSLLTADLAVSYDRDVFAVPGRVGDRYSEGCNDLIRKMKAAMVTNASDILDLIGYKHNTIYSSPMIPFEEESSNDDPIFHLIKERQPIQYNDLIFFSGMDVATLSNRLFELELEGLIKTIPGGRYILSH